MVLVYYEGINAKFETFLEHYESPHASIAVLKRMNFFKFNVKRYDVFQTVPFIRTIFGKKVSYSAFHFARRDGFQKTNGAGKFFMTAENEQTLVSLPRAAFQGSMEFFYNFFGKRFFAQSMHKLTHLK